MGIKGEHIIDFGYQQDNYKLSILKNTTGTSTWETAAAGTLTSKSEGKSQLQSLYAQDAWKFAPLWRAVLGLRAEQWGTSGGLAYTSTSGTSNYSDRSEVYYSPKLAISHLLTDTWMLKASTGRAVRMPTVHEMYGSTSAGASTTYANDPNLRPEKSQTTELTAEKDLGHGILRTTAFFENTHDAIASQTTLVSGVASTYIQNIRRIESTGLEVAYSGQNFLKRGLDFSSSVTYVDSRIKENDGYVSVAGDTINKYQIRVPMWRANALANYHWDEKLNTSLGARYASSQFGRNDNSDINGFAYTGNSKFFVVDARLLYKVDRQWSVAAGIDNLNNYKYWNYHQYPMRTYHAELRWDL
jgi:iron complex outermembrane receptor protein